MTSEPELCAVKPGQVLANGHIYMTDAKGKLTPIELVAAKDLLQDETVRSLFAAAERVANVLVDFKVNAFDEIDAFNELLADKYGARRGGQKGNITLISYDGLIKLQVQVQDQFRFGPELQQAKALVDECIGDWSSDSRVELRAIVMDAFQVDHEGQVNRGALFRLLKLEIDDDRWKRGMQAIVDAKVLYGSKRYIRIYHRANQQAAWVPLSLDAATA